MTQPDAFEVEINKAYETGKLKSVASKAELNRVRAAARATAIKDRQVNIRLEERRPASAPVAPKPKTSTRRSTRSDS